MKRVLFSGMALLAMATLVAAGEPRSLRSILGSTLAGQKSEVLLPPPLSPVPDPLYSRSVQQTSQQVVVDPAAPVVSEPVTGTIIPTPEISLYTNVRYRAVRNIAPCAVPTIIQVADPCNKVTCCKNCVSIEVCAPPCDPSCVKVTRDGDKVCYDYGKYSIVARTVGNHIVVHYYD